MTKGQGSKWIARPLESEVSDKDVAGLSRDWLIGSAIPDEEAEGQSVKTIVLAVMPKQ